MEQSVCDNGVTVMLIGESAFKIMGAFCADGPVQERDRPARRARNPCGDEYGTASAPLVFV